MIKLEDKINIPDLGVKKFVINIHVSSDMLLPNEAEFLKQAIREFIQSGEQIGDYDAYNYIIEFMYVKEKEVEDAYEVIVIGILRGIDEPSMNCKAVYKITINYKNLTVDVYDISFIADLENRTRIEELVKT